MKILFIIPGYSIGGTLSSLINLLEILKRKNSLNINIDIFAISPEGSYRDTLTKYGKVLSGGNSINGDSSFNMAVLVRKVKRFLSKLGVDITPFVFRRTARKLEGNKYDIVIGFQEGYATHLTSYFKNTCKIAWIHCDYKNYLRLIKSEPEYRCYNKIDKVVCVSKYTLQQFRDCINHRNATYIYNTILDDRIKIKAEEQIEDIDFPDSKFIIVSVGRLHPVKQFNKIPVIISFLKRKGIKDFVWYLIGGGNDEVMNQIHQEKMKYDAEELILLGEKNNPYPYIKQADLMVCTSLSEACPYAIIESKVLNVPVVTTNFGSATEFITNGFDGYVEPIETIADKIGLMINDTQMYHVIKDNVRGFEYDNDKIINKIEQLLCL